MSGGEERDGVSLTNLDQPLFDGAQAAKRDLVDYLDAVRDRIIPVLLDRPLSVIRVLRGQPPFMQKNVPKYTPPWVRTVALWAEASKREVRYALVTMIGLGVTAIAPHAWQVLRARQAARVRAARPR